RRADGADGGAGGVAAPRDGVAGVRVDELFDLRTCACRGHGALRLRDDLRGDDHDVAVLQVEAVGGDRPADLPAQIHARPYAADAGDRISGEEAAGLGRRTATPAGVDPTGAVPAGVVSACSAWAAPGGICAGVGCGRHGGHPPIVADRGTKRPTRWTTQCEILRIHGASHPSTGCGARLPRPPHVVAPGGWGPRRRRTVVLM